MNMMQPNDIVRRNSHTERILGMLVTAAGQGNPVYTDDLAKFSRNHTARIYDLRKRGHVIVCERVPESDSRYADGATCYWYHGHHVITTDPAPVVAA